jgi:pyruvate formate lyase activating enzyme
MHGRVFNIQRFSINDGPGIRTSVFVKGCNLRCLWCHNPESNSPHQEIQYFPQKCTRCGECIRVCPTGAHYITADDEKVFDRSQCDLCGLCVEGCMYGALEFVVKYMEPAEVVQLVAKDIDYYRNSGGGLTISGGEPLLQKEFVRAVFELTKEQGIHNALDTALNVTWGDLEYVLPSTDLVLLDLKSMDSEAHRRGTGVDNKRILENAHRLAKQGVDLIVRVPVIPGINDSPANMAATAEFLGDFPRLLYVELLPYHDLGVDKFTSLGKSNQTAVFNIPTEETMRELAQNFEVHRIPVRIN